MQSRPTAELAILLVDDERQTLKYFERAFAKDFPVLTAPSADEAEAIVDANPGKIGVIISDQRMPGRSGVSLLNSVRRKHPGIVRMLTTAYSELDDAIEAVNRGEIFRYIVKPWDFDLLRQEIKTGLLVFSLQTERELLIGEKLIARQRMMAVDRARDLAVIVAALPKLRHARLAVDDYVRDCAANFTASLSLNEAGALDLWSQPQAEVKHMGAVAAEAARVADELAAASAKAGTSFAAVLKDAVSDTASQAAAAKVRVVADDAAAATTDVPAPVLRGIIAGTLSAFIGAAPEGGDVHVSLSGGQVHGTPGTELRVTASEVTRGADTVLYSAAAGAASAEPGQFFASYLAARECGGCIKVKPEGRGLIAVVGLPNESGKAQVPEVRADWLQKLFQHFEDWPA